MSGWISVHRKIQEHWVWEEKPFTKGQAWIDLLLLVNHKDGKTFMDGQLIDVRRGEHITSEPKLAERWGWSRTKVRNFLDLLQKDGMIENVKEDRKRTRLKVLNYDDYQDVKNNRKTTEEQQKDNRKTTEEQQKNINNNDNNENNDNNDNKNINTTCVDSEESPPLKYDEDSVYYQVALYLRKKILEFNPKCKVPDSNPKALKKWSDTIRLTIERDKRTIEEMREIVQFIFKDDFWCTVVQSPANLRKNWDKIWSKMKVSNKAIKTKANSNLSKLEEMYLKAKAEEEEI